MSNNLIRFTIRKVFPGSDKQKAIGIYATFNMTIDGPDGIVASLNDMKLKRRKDGQYYMQSAFRQYDSKDQNTDEKTTKRVEFIKIFPEEKNWPKQDIIVNEVLKQLETAGATQKDNSPSVSVSTTDNSKPSPNQPW